MFFQGLCGEKLDFVYTLEPSNESNFKQFPYGDHTAQGLKKQTLIVTSKLSEFLIILEWRWFQAEMHPDLAPFIWLILLCKVACNMDHTHHMANVHVTLSTRMCGKGAVTLHVLVKVQKLFPRHSVTAIHWAAERSFHHSTPLSTFCCMPKITELS